MSYLICSATSKYFFVSKPNTHLASVTTLPHRRTTALQVPHDVTMDQVYRRRDIACQIEIESPFSVHDPIVFSKSFACVTK